MAFWYAISNSNIFVNQHNDVTIISYCLYENICAVDYPDNVLTVKHTIFSLIRPKRKNVKHNNFPKGKIAYFRSTIYWDVIIFFLFKKTFRVQVGTSIYSPCFGRNERQFRKIRSKFHKVTKEVGVGGNNLC